MAAIFKAAILHQSLTFPIGMWSWSISEGQNCLKSIAAIRCSISHGSEVNTESSSRFLLIITGVCVQRTEHIKQLCNTGCSQLLKLCVDNFWTRFIADLVVAIHFWNRYSLWYDPFFVEIWLWSNMATLKMEIVIKVDFTHPLLWTVRYLFIVSEMKEYPEAFDSSCRLGESFSL